MKTKQSYLAVQYAVTRGSHFLSNLLSHLSFCVFALTWGSNGSSTFDLESFAFSFKPSGNNVSFWDVFVVRLGTEVGFFVTTTPLLAPIEEDVDSAPALVGPPLLLLPTPPVKGKRGSLSSKSSLICTRLGSRLAILVAFAFVSLEETGMYDNYPRTA